ncbi:hypothetical protein O181_116758, partial [Austropuccinia psidii MF-1]|nr:hypothetical protein [Austropuccinia psidii MF-1]
EENYIPLETQSQANTPVTPSESEGSKGNGKRYSEGLITAKQWTPIATQRNRKPKNSDSIQGKPILTTCKGKITIINPVVTSKGKFPKSADNKFVQGTVKGFHGNPPEDREGLSRTRRPGRGHRGNSGGWQDSEGNNTHSAIHFPIQQEPQTRGLERYGSSSSAPPTPQRFISMEHGQQRPHGNHQRLESHQAVHTPGGEGKRDKGESSHYQSYRRTADPDRAYLDYFMLTRSRLNQLSSGLKPFNHQQINGQESPFFTIPGIFKEKTRIQGQKKSHLQPEEERGRPNDPEAVGFGERSAQEPQVVVNNSRISSPINRNITPTQIEHNVVTPESNLNSDALWLQMSQFPEQTP